MLANSIRQLIALGRTDGLSEKIEAFYKAGKLTKEQYDELTAALAKKE